MFPLWSTSQPQWRQTQHAGARALKDRSFGSLFPQAGHFFAGMTRATSTTANTPATPPTTAPFKAEEVIWSHMLPHP